MSTFLV